MSRFIRDRLKTLAPYVPGEQPKGVTLIKLNTNESPFPPCPGVKACVGEVDRMQLYSDPDNTEITLAIAEHYGLSRENVICGNGSDEILAFFYMAYGDKPLTMPEISYGFYPVFAALLDTVPDRKPLKADFSVDINDYLTPGHNVVIANPNAPTGLTLSLDEIETILKAHPDDVVAIDEAYVDFGAQTALPLIDRYENLLIVRTCSKSRSLAGLRVGYALGPAGLIADLSAVRNSFNPYNLDRLAQAAGAAAMRDVEYFKRCTGAVIATRERIKQALNDLGCVQTDSKANFLFVKLPNVSGPTAQKKLRERGVLVRRFDTPSIRDYLRVTVGSDEQMDAFLTAVKAIIEEGE